MVEDAAVSLGGEEPERNADEDREEHRRERELDRGRETVPELVRHRPAARDADCRSRAGRSSSGSPSTARRSAGRACTGGGSARSSRASRAHRGAPAPAEPGRSADPAEDEDREPEKDRDEEEQPADDEAKHLSSAGSLHLLCRRRPARTAPARRGSACSPITLFWNASAGSSGRTGPPAGTSSPRSIASWYSSVALLEVRLRVGPLQQVEQRRVVEPELVVLRAEVHVQEVRRVTEVTRPAEQVQARPCRSAPRRGSPGATAPTWNVTLNPDFSRLAPNASAFCFGSGMYGRETLVGYQNSIGTGSCSARLREELLRLVRVVRCSRHALRREADDLARQELVRHLAAAGVEALDDRVAVEAVRDRLADDGCSSNGLIFWFMPT